MENGNPNVSSHAYAGNEKQNQVLWMPTDSSREYAGNKERIPLSVAIVVYIPSIVRETSAKRKALFSILFAKNRDF